MLAFFIFSLWRFLFQHISYFRISCSWQKHVILPAIWFMACISHLQISLLYCHFLCDLYIGIFLCPGEYELFVDDVVIFIRWYDALEVLLMLVMYV